MKINVIFRACDAVTAVNKSARYAGLSKTELIKICFLSLVKSLEKVDHTLYIHGDKLSDELLKFFKTFDVELSNSTMGNDLSIQRAFEMALKMPTHEWVYFCEDDYLHRPDAFEHVEDLVRNRQEITAYKRPGRKVIANWLYSPVQKAPLVIFLPDYIDRYKPGFKRRRFIFLGKKCHWRQVSHTTFSFITKVETVARFKKIFLESAQGANDGHLYRNLYAGSHLFGRALCLSPIPGLSSHMHHDTMTPLVDWNSLIETYKKQL